MKTIASLTGPDFLRACNRVRHEVSKFLETTGVHDLRKIMPKGLPEIPAGATETEKKDIQAQREKMIEEQARKNLDAIFDRLLDEYPDATYKMLCTLAIPEGDEELDGFDLIDAALELIGSQKTMDFFIRLGRSAGLITAG